jgi:outer membrane protein with beta-barrel domain
MRLHTGILCAFVLFGWTAPSQAQHYATDRGVWLVGGTARITNFRDIGNDASTFVLDLSPRLGYFVVPGLAMTANLEYGRFSYDAGVTSTYGLGPGMTYYFRHRQTVLNPFLSARTLYVHERVNPDGASDFTSDSFTWLVAAGAALFLARNVALTGEIFYNHAHFSDEFSGTTQSNNAEEYGTQFGVSVHVF